MCGGGEFWIPRSRFSDAQSRECFFFVVYLDWPNQKAELDSATKPVKSFVRFSIRTSIVKVSRKRETILVDFKEFFFERRSGMVWVERVTKRANPGGRWGREMVWWYQVGHQVGSRGLIQHDHRRHKSWFFQIVRIGAGRKDSGYKFQDIFFYTIVLSGLASFLCRIGVQPDSACISRVAIPGRRRFQQDRSRVGGASRMSGPKLDALVRAKDSRK